MPTHKKTITPHRGEIWLVNFDPTQGDEIRKQRPALVLGTKALGLNITIVIPLTTWQPEFSKVWHIVPVQATPQSGLSAVSGASCYHVRSIANTRFMRKLGLASAEEVDEITACVQNCVEA